MRRAILTASILTLAACSGLSDQDPTRSEMVFWRLQSDGAGPAELCRAARDAEAAWRQVLADPPTAMAPHHKYPATNARYWGRRASESCRPGEDA
ncbi:MAG: hypothetical protein A2792_00040 [Sphingomonadales bacterium RIFCSPHIGHO2_01_FULL_65_20]|nr:MAG: hypothetical protein A2792_00040 [Sphingomonadales bacterium RIFCSPHIGHO2_01_FULL_65_20]